MIVGCYGLSGSGKSTVARLLRDRFGFTHADLDQMAKDLEPVLAPRIAKDFPAFVVGGVVDRKALGRHVFSNRGELEKLNAIYHDAVWDSLRDMLNTSHDVVVDAFDMPIGLQPDILIHVTAPQPVMLARLAVREPGTDRDVLLNRLDRQMEKAPKLHIGHASWDFVEIDTTKDDWEVKVLNVIVGYRRAHMLTTTE